MAKATFAAGCFWGVEHRFRQLDGVLATRVGYAGGRHPNPSYEEVCSGQTGHAEAVELEFDSERISYENLLEVFWSCHDPTQLNRQGPDVGTQYRSAIFVHDELQQQAADASKVIQSQKSKRPIVTEILRASEFFPAEEYHQLYFEKRGIRDCH